ncbi:MAG: MerR family transcriptional regulator [Deltaproteobacteria bacterium]|nr:MerR family transcriptional regulator [Deltaproteobacteria bacterium]
MPSRRKREPRGLKIGELSRRTETPKETIHFYLREGLLEAPAKTSRNMAYYDESHVSRLLAIKKLRTESYLPLSVIKQLIANGELGASQRRLDVAGEMLGARTELEPVSSSELAERAKLSEELVAKAIERGLLRPRDTSQGARFGVLDVRIAEVLAISRSESTLNEVWWLERFEIIEKHLRAEVEEEVSHFFGRVIGGGDPEPAIDLLRGGRETIGRYLALSRARALTESMEEIFEAVREAVSEESPPSWSLSSAARERLGSISEVRRLCRVFDQDPSLDRAVGLLVFGVATGELDELAARLAALSEFCASDEAARWRMAEAWVELGVHAPVIELGLVARTPLHRVLMSAARLGRLQSLFASGRAELVDWAKSGEILRDLVRALAELQAVRPELAEIETFEALRTLFLLARVEELCPPFLALGRHVRPDFELVFGSSRALKGTSEDPGFGALDRIGLNAALALGRLRGGTDWADRASEIEPAPVPVLRLGPVKEEPDELGLR